MTSLPLGADPPSGWAGPAELNYLLQQVRSARAEVEALRSHARGLGLQPEQARLLESLERYVEALRARHLPVPPAIRDELTLQRHLVPPEAVTRSATRRRPDRK